MPQHRSADTLDLVSAHHVAALADVATIEENLPKAGSKRSVARLILEAVLAQLNADIDRCTHAFRAALDVATEHERPYVVDLYVPVLIMQGAIDDAQAQLDSVSEVPGPLAGLYEPLAALVAAMAGNPFEISIAATASAVGELNRARALQRIAVASYYGGDFDLALEAARKAVRVFERVRAYRLSATAFSVVYNVQHAVLGDIEAAHETARAMARLAEKGRDDSIWISSIVAQYEIVAEFGDESEVARLKSRINSVALPTQYQERFARGVADALPYAWRGDFAAFNANTVVLRDLAADNRPVLALATAFRSLAEVALGDIASARRSSRNALALSTLSKRGAAAYDVRYNRLARGLAAAACIFIGDSTRGRRAMQRKGLENDDVGDLIATAEGASWRSASRRLRGYARLVEAVRVQLASQQTSILTTTELEVLRMLAEGLTAPQVALQLQRSVHTVRAHTRNIISKFDVSGRGAAINQARRAGLLS